MGNWKIVVNGTACDLENDYGYRVEQHPGSGMPPLSNISTDFGLLDGAVYQRTIANTRTFSLIGTLSGSSVSDLHLKRKNLIDAVKPDRTASPEAIELRYAGGGSTLVGSAFYDGGLEFGNAQRLTEPQIALRFTMFDPYWSASESSTCDVAVSQEVASANRIIYRDNNGLYQSVGGGVNGQVEDIAISNTGASVFVGGVFTQVGGSLTACRLASWDGENWNNPWLVDGTSSGANGQVSDIVVAPDDSIYVGGLFTDISGCTLTSVGHWDGSDWWAMGAGLSTTTAEMVLGPDGKIYAGGTFTGKLQVWTPSTSAWTTVGSTPDNTVNDLVFSTTSSALYIGGDFDDLDGTTASNVAKYDGGAWTALDGGTQDSANFPSVLALGMKSDGTLYTGGDYDLIGSCQLSTSNISQWNDVAWSNLGASGLKTKVSGIHVDNNDFVYVFGDFTDAEGLSLPDRTRMAGWNGTTWLPIIPISFVGTPNINSVVSGSGNELYIGHSDSGTASTAGITTITNSGTATTAPIFSASGPTGNTTARLYELINYTNNSKLYFDLQLVTGEVVTLDFKKRAFTSSIKGNIVNTILPGSNLATWKLESGSNSISLFIDDATASATLQFIPRFWSIDGGAS